MKLFHLNLVDRYPTPAMNTTLSIILAMNEMLFGLR
jgi:hypothetical protein